jgi:hypothetical protein
MRVSDVAFALPLCLLAPAGDGVSGALPLHFIEVRVYDNAGLSTDVEGDALTVASAALAPASIAVIWSRCESAGPGCGPPGSRPFLLRVVRARAVEHHDEAVPLGFAYVDAGTGSAVLATIYFDRVARLARKAGIDVSTLLGHAIAHELGHLLLASNSHSANGLMRPVWLGDELRRKDPMDWRFTPQDVAAIRANLEGRHRWAN